MAWDHLASPLTALALLSVLCLVVVTPASAGEGEIDSATGKSGSA